MPAAAVIPAPIAYIKVVVVKKLVVGFRRVLVGLNCFNTDFFTRVFCQNLTGDLRRLSVRTGRFTLKKLNYFSKNNCRLSNIEPIDSIQTLLSHIFNAEFNGHLNFYIAI